MKVALLNADNVFLGQREIAVSDFDPAVHIDASDYGGDCDNAPGKYRWNRAAKCFEPINTEQEEMANDFRRIVIFAAGHAIATGDAEIGPLIRKHFPTEYRTAKLAKDKP